MSINNICFKKCKVRANEEAFIKDVIANTERLIETHNLPITQLRFGRQPKSFGFAAAPYHVYKIRQRSIKDAPVYEFYINVDKVELTQENIDYLEFALLNGSAYWGLRDDSVEIDFNKEDAMAYALTHNYKFGKSMMKHFEQRLYADKIAGTNFANADTLRLNKLAAKKAQHA